MKKSFYDVPEEDREELVQLKPWLLELRMGLPQGDDRTRYLFEIYNEYLSKSNVIQEETCSSCRGKVFKKTMEAIEFYETNGIHGEY
jgi:hypothetical protein